jgi:hypothetical protein
MAGGDHFVIHKFFFGTKMAFEAFFRAVNDVARIDHPETRRGFFVMPVAAGVRAEPGLRRAVTIFAGDAVGKFERAAALFGRSVERVTKQAFGSVFGFGVEFENARHAFANWTGERLVGAAVLVLQNPGGIFILIDTTVRDGLHAAMATGGGAGARADVLDGLGRIHRRRRGRGTKKEWNGEDEG